MVFLSRLKAAALRTPGIPRKMKRPAISVRLMAHLALCGCQGACISRGKTTTLFEWILIMGCKHGCSISAVHHRQRNSRPCKDIPPLNGNSPAPRREKGAAVAVRYAAGIEKLS